MPVYSKQQEIDAHTRELSRRRAQLARGGYTGKEVADIENVIELIEKKLESLAVPHPPQSP